ncbi:MAG: four helix bundle protein [Arachidicoccus sp.]|nr:four helix bundle protein [Arachidicoccus sp.]
MMANDILKDKSFSFALRIVKLHKFISNEKKEYIISKQVMRSGCSIGASIREAKNAESGKDFIHKLSIAQKECDETLYWLELLFAAEYLNEKEFLSLQSEAIEIIKIVKKSIITRRKNLVIEK